MSGDRAILVKNEELPQADISYPLENSHGDDNADDYTPTFSPVILPEAVTTNDDRATSVHDDVGGRDVELLLPQDRFHFVYFTFYLLGVATMTPWNFFVIAEDYWMYKFRNISLNGTDPSNREHLTRMQRSFSCDLTLTASIAGTTFLILNAIYGQRFSLRCKMMATLWMIFVFFIVTSVLANVDTDRWQEQFFVFTMFTVVVINVSSAVMTGSIYGAASLFPSRYMTALVSGQSLGGILAALAFILVLAVGMNPTATALTYFIFGIVLIFLSIVNYSLLSRGLFFQYYIGRASDSKCDTGVVAGTANATPNVTEIFSKIYIHAVAVVLLFTVTLSVFPGVTVLMQSEYYGHGKTWNDIYYLPVVNYLLFNVGDYCGRIVAGAYARPTNQYTVLLMVIARTIFIPLFLCSNTNLHYFLPVLVNSDAAFITLMALFALTNGYFTNILLLTAPMCCKHYEREGASSIMAASLSCGLALGSLLSMVFVQLL